MRIVSWHVDGFGILKDYDENKLGDGITLISGDNETGKSTLLGFLRAMLFGFPKKSTRARQYAPLRGGGHGGHVVISDDEGRAWTIERYADRKDRLSVTDAAGGIADEAQLRRLLGGADEKLFNSVFAFDLGELTGFESLDAAGVRERIFAAGVTGAGRSARQAMDELSKRADSLLKQRAGQAVINSLVRDLDAVDERLRAARERDQRYGALVPLLDEKTGVLEQISPELDRVRQRKARFDALVQSRPEWVERMRLGSELDALPHTTDEALPQRVTELSTELTRQRTLEEQLSGLQVNAARGRAKCAEALQRLGVDWPLERALAFDDSIAVRDEVRTWGKRLALLDARPAAAPAFARRPLVVTVVLAAVCAIAALATFVAGFAQLGAGLLAASLLLGVVGGVAVASRRGDAADTDQETLDQWRAWLQTRGLEGLTPAGVSDLLTAIGATREADRSAGDAEERLADISRQAGEWDVLARKELLAAGRLPETVAADDLRAALLVLDKQLQQRSRLAQRCAEIDASVSIRLGNGKETISELTGGDVVAWRDESQRLAQKMRDLEQQRDAGNKEIGSLRKEIEDIAGSDEIADRQTERESLKAELAGKIREYRVSVTACGLIRETLRQYVRLHQPAVLGSAGSLFATITGGRYVGVEADAGDNGNEVDDIVVVPRAGTPLTTDRLSRGTAEQLYLAVRLALAADFASRSTPLPVIVDDCLVNFDPARQRGIAKALADYANERQLLLFTCHPETERIFIDTLGDRLALRRLPPVTD
jgi:uncharacterized protein YhaN